MQSVTNSDNGQRGYYADQASPPRWMRSVTSHTKIVDKPGMVISAGRLGMESAIEAACETYTEGPATNVAVFRDRLMARLRGMVGTYANGNLKPPHVSQWTLKADIGKAAHIEIETWNKARLKLDTPLPYRARKAFERFTDEDHAKVAHAFKSFVHWAEVNEWEPLAAETTLWLEGWAKSTKPDLGDDQTPLLEHDVAFTLDMAGLLRGEETILDAKSGSAVYDESWLQVAVQREGADQRRLCGRRWRRAGILHVPAAGGQVSCQLDLLRDHERDLKGFDHFAGAGMWLFGDKIEGEEG